MYCTGFVSNNHLYLGEPVPTSVLFCCHPSFVSIGQSGLLWFKGCSQIRTTPLCFLFSKVVLTVRIPTSLRVYIVGSEIFFIDLFYVS